MISRNRLKYLHSLRLKKFRELNGAFLVEGVKIVDELLHSNFKILEILGTSAWRAKYNDLVETGRFSFHEISEKDLETASNLTSPNEVIAVVEIPEKSSEETGLSGNIVLILDKIQDPGNLGTMIRTADWFGIRNILCSDDTADVYNPKVIQATMGSVFRVNIRYGDIAAFIDNDLSGWYIYGTSAEGADLYGSETGFPAAVIIGNESQGISAKLLPKVNLNLAIPTSSGTTESLNAAVATGIFCAEFTRRLNLQL